MFFSSKTEVLLVLVSGLISLVFCVIGFEVYKNIEYRQWKESDQGSRWYGKMTKPSENLELMWEYKPYSDFKNLKTNRYGFRDDDKDWENKAGDEYRIAMVGDSVTLGLFVDKEDVFESRFEKLLQENSGLRIDVMNLGVDGYSAPQIRALVQFKVKSFLPDEVIYVMCLNDFDFKESSGGKYLYFNKPNSFFFELLEKTYLRFSGVDYHEYYFKKNKAMVYKELLLMAKLLKENNTKFKVLVLPVFPQEFHSFESYSLTDIHSEISEFFKTNDIKSYDLSKVFMSRGAPPKYYASDIWHPNAIGHEFIGSKMFSRYMEGW